MPIDIEDGLAPGLLVAAPDLDDPFFSKSVILLTEADDEGAMGFIVNKRLPIELGNLSDSLEVSVSERAAEEQVVWGGPVRPQRGWLLAFHPDIAEYLGSEPTFVLDDGLYVVAELPTLQAFLTQTETRDFMLVLGYSGWGPEQLSEEMKEGTWLPLDYDARLLFDYSGEEMWMEALERIGINPAFYFSSNNGSASA
jgi:putative transcriptional regulator